MENNILDIKKAGQEINQIKYPLVFLFELISNMESFNDENFSIILRLFLKSHTNVGLEFNLKKLFRKELSNWIMSWNVLNDFYKLLNKKISLIFILKKWHLVYENNEFWSLDIIDQNEYLFNVKNRFLSVYDCAKGGIPLHNKVIMLLKDSKVNRDIVLETIIDRLKIVLEMFGTKLFQSLEIPLITMGDFYKLSNENLIKYLLVIWEKFNELLNQTIKLFDSYNLVCIQLDNLLNPIIININTSNIDSETEADDIHLLSK
jgi:hypothetical protein